jgi:hypothetical protein
MGYIMETNILVAISNLVNNPITNIVAHYGSSNRINNVGEALEIYVKDLFCNTMNVRDEYSKIEAYHKYFSMLGNKNNPPDFVIRNGDAIEVKKIERVNGGEISLNSSYPKDKLYCDDPMINSACRNCEDWKEKDMIYAIGSMYGDSLRELWMVYGDCYASNKEVYQRIRTIIKEGVNSLLGVEFTETKELAKIHRVDPLGITYLRVRGMWGIKIPQQVFEYVVESDQTAAFKFNAILLKEKYYSLPERDRDLLEKLAGDKLVIKDVKIKSPNNPANLLDAKIIRFRL